MVRRSTWIVLVLVLILAGVLVYMNREQQIVEEVAQDFPTLPSYLVIGQAEGMPNRFRLETETGEVIEVGLDMQNEWQVNLPVAGRANQGNLEAAVTKIISMRFSDEMQGISPSDLGVNPPAQVLTVYMKSGSRHVIEIGDQTPSGIGYYVRLDGDRLLIVEASAIDTLLASLLPAPYQMTPTPSPLPHTATPVPAMETVTPAP